MDYTIYFKKNILKKKPKQTKNKQTKNMYAIRKI